VLGTIGTGLARFRLVAEFLFVIDPSHPNSAFGTPGEDASRSKLGPAIKKAHPKVRPIQIKLFKTILGFFT
jgi:hypothetical protein